MKILVEAGHGMNYRARQQEDLGLLGEDGISESRICIEIGMRLRATLANRKHRANLIYRGNTSKRLNAAKSYNSQLLVSLHMTSQPDGLTNGSVLYATDESYELAKALGHKLDKDIKQVLATGTHALLCWTPAIEIELGNMASQQDIKNLRYAPFATNMCQRIADVIEAEANNWSLVAPSL